MRTIDLQLVICVAGFFYANKVYAKDSIILPLGDDPQAIIDSHPPGTDFELATGIHRGYEIILKDGDELTGQTGQFYLVQNCLRDGGLRIPSGFMMVRIQRLSILMTPKLIFGNGAQRDHMTFLLMIFLLSKNTHPHWCMMRIHGPMIMRRIRFMSVLILQRKKWN